MSNEKRFKLDMGFGEALRRLARTDPKEVEKALKPDLEKFDRVKTRIKETREEIERGARSGKPKFRL